MFLKSTSLVTTYNELLIGNGVMGGGGGGGGGILKVSVICDTILTILQEVAQY